MNRRGFLQYLGTIAAGTMLPSLLGFERIARAPAWAKEVVLYRTSVPLTAGNYSFTAYAGEYGMYFGGVKAFGGETLFEIPKTDHPMESPKLSREGITCNRSIDFCDPLDRASLQRGEPVTRA